MANSIEDIDSQMNMYDDKMHRATQRYWENYEKKAVPRTLYYTDENDNLVNKVEETLQHHKLLDEKVCFMWFLNSV